MNKGEAVEAETVSQEAAAAKETKPVEETAKPKRAKGKAAKEASTEKSK